MKRESDDYVYDYFERLYEGKRLLKEGPLVKSNALDAGSMPRQNTPAPSEDLETEAELKPEFEELTQRYIEKIARAHGDEDEIRELLRQYAIEQEKLEGESPMDVAVDTSDRRPEGEEE